MSGTSLIKNGNRCICSACKGKKLRLWMCYCPHCGREILLYWDDDNDHEINVETK